MALTNLAGDLALWQNILNMTIIYTFLCKVENFLIPLIDGISRTLLHIVG
jgi:hypothetical protein